MSRESMAHIIRLYRRITSALSPRESVMLPACNMFVACWTADREALSAVFSDHGKFYAADPYTFLFASLMVLTFGAEFFAVDTLAAKRLKAVE